MFGVWRIKADLYCAKNADSIKLLRFKKCLISNLKELQEMIVEERVAELCSEFYLFYMVI